MASRIYLALILVFLAAAGTRLAFLHFAASGTFSNPDTSGYQGLADSLLSDWTYASDKAAGAPGGFPADLQRPPGYPSFLYLISPSSGVNRAWVAFIQSMLGGVFAVFLAVMATRLVNATVGIIAGLFYAFDWITIIHTPIVIAETLYAIALTGAVIAFALYLRELQIILMWSLAIAGVTVSWRAGLAPRPIVCLFVIAVLLALLPSASPVGYSRFRVHAVPSLRLLAAIGAWRARLWRGQRLSG